jgi:hypothetical protein
MPDTPPDIPSDNPLGAVRRHPTDGRVAQHLYFPPRYLPPGEWKWVCLHIPGDSDLTVTLLTEDEVADWLPMTTSGGS